MIKQPASAPVAQDLALRAMLGLTGLAGLWLITRSAAVALLGQAAPDLAMRFAPASGRAIIYSAVQGQPAVRDAAFARGMQRAPLSEVPFYIKAQDAKNAQDFERATELLEAGVDRRPRRYSFRVALLELYLRRGHWSEALDEIRFLHQIRPQLNGPMADLLLALSQDTRARAIMRRKFAANPRWARTALATARTRTGDEQLFANLEILGPKGAAPSPQSAALLAGTTLNGYEAWMSSLPDGLLDEARAVYDGGFKGLPGDTAFNWNLIESKSAVARIGRHGARANGLHVRVTSGKPVRVAHQDLVLSPGDYFLRVRTGATGEGSGSLSWVVSCVPAGRALTAPLSTDGPDQKRSFTVPGNCSRQRLALEASSAVDGRPFERSVTRVAIEPRS